MHVFSGVFGNMCFTRIFSNKGKGREGKIMISLY
jgi:hypothetical protein